MTEYRESLLNRMCALYNLEHPCVVQFAQMCEEWEPNDWNDTILRILTEAHEADPFVYEKI